MSLAINFDREKTRTANNFDCGQKLKKKDCEKEQTFQKQKKNCAFLFQDLLLCCFRKKRKKLKKYLVNFLPP